MFTLSGGRDRENIRCESAATLQGVHMTRFCLAVIMAGALAAATVGCRTTKTAHAGCPGGAQGKAGEAVWCDACNVGYVDGTKTKCKGCFTAKTGGTPCEACAAKKSG